MGNPWSKGPTIASVAAEVFSRHRTYADHDARIYESLRDLAQVSLRLFGQVEARFLADKTQTADHGALSTEELHREFIRSIRDGQQEVFPLVEVSIVGFEILRVTEALIKLDDALSQVSIS